MTVAESVLRKIENMPLDRQREVLRFVEAMERQADLPLRDPAGLLSGQPSDLTLEDFAAARRDMQRGFPRELHNA